ncbi:protein of unknown function [Bradyrhizobium vignae]|uniref:Uncharacterized protein n=1 Tax=Bradyrhizobium vignae TaxID=1549949 RepID=A0A2U3PRU3_9BRAD|nr:protein of unknown function [Bradyrhizobium vignae]
MGQMRRAEALFHGPLRRLTAGGDIAVAKIAGRAARSNLVRHPRTSAPKSPLSSRTSVALDNA